MDAAIEVTLYTRAACSLCEKAKASIRAAGALYRLNVSLREIDIDDDPVLRERYTNDVPVVLIRGVEAFRHVVDPGRFAEVARGGVAGASSLANESCVPCHGGVPPVEGAELETLTRALGGGWNAVRGHHLEREFAFPDFAQALAFTNRVGAIAEQQGHHPDIHLSWGKVRIEIWTHAIDGLTRSDFILAAKISAAA